MDRERQNNNQPKNGKLIGLAIVLLVMAPQFALILGLFAGVFYVIKQAAQSKSQSGQSAFELPKFEQPKFEQPRFGNGKQSKLDECPQSLFCFHKDKGEHHVARGKEIDPWDRPDIDIRKYQRKE